MVGTSTETALLEPVEKAKKKLSFREPEIMGYYMMQMKQGVADRLSKRGKSTSSKNGVTKTASSPTKNRTFVNHRSSVADDDEPHDKMHDSNNYRDVIAPADSAEDLSLDNQAMRVVRSVGQAFEECNKNQQSSPTSPHAVFEYDGLDTDETAITSTNFDNTGYDEQQQQCENDYHQQNLNSAASFRDDYDRLMNATRNVYDDLNISRTNSLRRPAKLETDTPASNANNIDICHNHVNGERQSPLRQTQFTFSEPPTTPIGVDDATFSYNMLNDPNTAGMSIGAAHQIQLLKERLEQQSQQTQAAIAQMRLLQDQLNAETAARMEAQTRTYRLLANNKQLLDHIGSLVGLLQQKEKLCSSEIPRQPYVQPSPHHSLLQYQNLLNMGAKAASLPRVGNQRTSMNGFLNLPQQQQQHGNIPVSPTFPDTTSQIGNFFNLSYTPIEKQHRVQNYNTNDLQQQEQLRQLARLYQSHPLQQQNLATVNTAATSFKNDYPSVGTNISNVDTRTKNIVDRDDSHLIKPLSQSDTITATDNNGRVRLIVPVNDEETRTGHRTDGNDADLSHSQISSTSSIRRTNKGDRQRQEKPNLSTTNKRHDVKCDEHPPPLKHTASNANMSNRRRKEESSTATLSQHLSPQPIIMRSTSEKAPKRSQLLLEVQRNAWARHTTK